MWKLAKMKNPLSPFGTFVVSVTFVLVASHLLLKYADGARFWLQQELAPVTAESHTILQEILGIHYIVTSSSKLHFSSSPYYFTPFDAVYTWRKMTETTSYQACARRSSSCVPLVVFDPFTNGAAAFEFSAEMMQHGYPGGNVYYCIGGQLAIGAEAIEKVEFSSRQVTMLTFSTPSGDYMVLGLPEKQLEKWRGRCS
ncbi:hypothetical protein [Pseudidiomarina halophila]|uniref:Uncharacterized protein n=1 Tax=Pseudidiomarina halophila TaxID=1449799 RepID=A0A432XVY1_9GAMM|nr:hypothetical protein [Pseudidiomarina halophila]RUO52813.1 hypothetical protein CWI69_07145 [Pseudidiomarina halophila]